MERLGGQGELLSHHSGHGHVGNGDTGADHQVDLAVLGHLAPCPGIAGDDLALGRATGRARRRSPTTRLSFCRVCGGGCRRLAGDVGDLTCVVPRERTRKKAITARTTRSADQRPPPTPAAWPLTAGPGPAPATTPPATAAGCVERPGSARSPSRVRVAPTAAIVVVAAGSPASTGRPSAKRSRSARNSSAVA